MTDNNYGTLYRARGAASGETALFFLDALGKRCGLFVERGQWVNDATNLTDIRVEPLGTSGTLGIDSPEDIDAVADFLDHMTAKYRAPAKLPASDPPRMFWEPVQLRHVAGGLRKTAKRESELAARRRKAKEILVGELVSASDDTINDMLATFPEIVDALLESEARS